MVICGGESDVTDSGVVSGAECGIQFCTEGMATIAGDVRKVSKAAVSMVSNSEQ